MGRATIENKKGEGQYEIAYLFNVELINFEIDRLTALRDEIDPNKLLEAQNLFDEKTLATRDAGDRLKELLQQLRGFVSPEVLTNLTTAVTALESADTTLGQVSNQRSNAGNALNASVASFPSSPPPEVSAAYNTAFNALSAAAFDLTDEVHALSESLTTTNTALNAAQAGTPDPDTVRSRIQDARDTFATLLANSSAVGTSLGTAATAVQDAKESVPSDGSWDTARTHAENAVFALTNSDENAGPVGATPLHSQVGSSYTAARTAVDHAADLMTPGKAETKADVKKAVKALSEANAEEGKARIALDALYLQLEQVEQRLDALEAIEQRKLMNAWCADYSTEIEEAKEVGTIEVPGEYTEKGRKGEIVIRPGFQPAGLEFNRARDGFDTPSHALSASGTFYNLALLPAWQKWKPTYRFAAVKKVNTDGTLEIELLNEAGNTQSSQQALNITPQPLPDPNNPTREPDPVDYAKVPVEYLDCHADAFGPGDEVVVEYQAQHAERPKVIGFRHDPQPCAAINFYTTLGDKLRITQAPPGGPGAPPETWARAPIPGPQFGNAYWVGEKKSASWQGPSARMFLRFPTPEFASPLLFYHAHAFSAPGLVHGAAVREGHFLAVCTTGTGSALTTSLYSAPIPAVTPGAGTTDCTWTLIVTFPATGILSPYYGVLSSAVVEGQNVSYFAPTPLFFNESATAGIIQHQTIRSGFQVLTVTWSAEEATFGATLAAVPFPVTPLEGLPDILWEESLGENSDDGDGNVVVNRRTHFYNVGGDISGATPRFLTLVTEFHRVDTHTREGPFLPWKGILGTGSEPTTETWTSSGSQTGHLLCEATGLDILLFDVTFSTSTVNENSYNSGGAVTPDNPGGLLSWVDTEASGSSTYLRRGIEHLNIAGDPVALVVRRAEGETASSSVSSHVLVGSDPRDTATGSASHAGTFTWTLHRGAETVALGTEAYTHPADDDLSESARDIRAQSDYTEDSYQRVLMPRAPYSQSAVDRAGHIITSSARWNTITAIPELPATVAGGNHDQFVPNGLS